MAVATPRPLKVFLNTFAGTSSDCHVTWSLDHSIRYAVIGSFRSAAGDHATVTEETEDATTVGGAIRIGGKVVDTVMISEVAPTPAALTAATFTSMVLLVGRVGLVHSRNDALTDSADQVSELR
jgi:hypothetical protein